MLSQVVYNDCILEVKPVDHACPCSKVAYGSAGSSRIWGADVRHWQFSVKMFAKMKELGPVGRWGGCDSHWEPLDPPTYGQQMSATEQPTSKDVLGNQMKTNNNVIPHADCVLIIDSIISCFVLYRLQELEMLQTATSNEKPNSNSTQAEEEVTAQTDEGSGGAIPKVRKDPNVPGATGSNLLTFSRQKLALLQCEYDQKSCAHCKKGLPSEELKTCVKCSMAKYCSKECQRKDWKVKHKIHCSEIERLRTIGVEENKNDNSNEDDQQGVPIADSNVEKEQQETLITEANVLTFSRQKLARIQCEYDPKKCSHCRKAASVDELKQCSRCKTAKYCSQKCQTKDWKEKHKIHCREIKRLEELIEKESIAKVPVDIKTLRKLVATPSGNPWFLKDYMVYGRMIVYQNKLVLCGTNIDVFSSIIDIYDINTHKKVGDSCFIRPGDIVQGLCIVKIGNTRYIAISTENSFEFLKQHRFEQMNLRKRSRNLM